VIVFDADGTLIGGEATDWKCFREAFEVVAGFALTEGFFARIEEVTARAIVHQALADRSVDERTAKEYAVRDDFLRRLRIAHGEDPKAFGPTAGTLALLREISEAAIPVAIATGDWHETISFKLAAAGIPFESIPMVTSSDHYGRAEIISAAVSKAGRSLGDAIYVGDALWDLRACRKLGIPFLGVGHRHATLRDAGADHVLLDLAPAVFWETRARAGKPNQWLRPAAAASRPVLSNRN
jgi:phosphoglycolate phosphatase-like HAD superfamily hydrolase